MLQGSLVANMFMGMVVLRRFYPRHKYAAVALVTVGIILSTIASQVGHCRYHTQHHSLTGEPQSVSYSAP